MSHSKQLDILGVAVDNVTPAEVRDICVGWASSDSCKLLFTPNPEMCVAASGNVEFASALASSDLNLADGFGLVLAARLLYGTKLTRNPGADTVDALVAEAARSGWRIYLLGGRGAAPVAAQNLRRLHPSLEVRAYGQEFIVDHSGASAQTPAVVEAISDFSPHLLLVALGAPKQELWLVQNRESLTRAGVRIGMGVGGTLDYIAGVASRGPRTLGRLGLEWLWRLLKQPKRFIRIFSATAIFAVLVLRQKSRILAKV